MRNVALVRAAEAVETLATTNSSPEITNFSSLTNYQSPKKSFFIQILPDSECNSGVLSLTYVGICQGKG